MKQILIVLFFATAVIADDDLKERIDSIVDIISKPKQTVTKADIDSLKDPFDKEQNGLQATTHYAPIPAQPSYRNIRFVLNAIINDRANINSRWLRQGDSISGFTVQNISNNSATLNYRGIYTRKLYLNRPDNTILNKGGSDEN